MMNKTFGCVRFVIPVLGILLFAGCQSNLDIVNINGLEYRTVTPPGVVLIENNYYVDETEITNINWLEYSFWMKKVFGDSSAEYIATLPDRTVWMNHPWVKERNNFVDLYLDHPAYRDYPVVGLTLEQAKDFCKWRSDRVAEMILIREGFIEFISAPHRDSFFTAERYFAGEYLNYSTPEKRLLMPKYTIPTTAQWEAFASTGLDTDTFPRGFDWTEKARKKQVKEGTHHFNDNTCVASDTTCLNQLMTKPVYAFYPNNYKLYHTSGNVAEMVAEEGIAKGGSWFHTPDSCAVTSNIPYEEPTMWLGFRCVCTTYIPE